ncbi:hypothetical protein BE61_77040 [Bradyrhizobium elkanii USDA 61]|nr:hypothetical protein BE61_77040 [Bradyrhizobium elkanii USDA 61]
MGRERDEPPICRSGFMQQRRALRSGLNRDLAPKDCRPCSVRSMRSARSSKVLMHRDQAAPPHDSEWLSCANFVVRRSGTPAKGRAIQA